MAILFSAFQRLLRTPGYALGLLGTLTLGLCLTITMFAILHAVALAPLPYPDDDKIVVIDSQRMQSGAQGSITPRDALTTLPQLAGLQGFGYYTWGGADLKVDDRPKALTINAVGGGFFDVLGVPPMLGRAIQAEDLGQARAVLSHATWMEQFGADPDIIGKAINLNWISPEIVGVMPPSFDYPSPEVAMWIAADESQYRNMEPGVYDNARYINSIGRLQPGTTPEQFNAMLENATGAVTGDAWVLHSERLLEHTIGARRPLLLALFGISMLVLLIACANAAHLVMVRGLGRLPQFGIQRALGASQSRIAFEFLAEVLIIGTLALVLSLTLSSMGLNYFVGLLDSGLPRSAEVTISLPVVAFAAAGTLLVLMICGAWPALRLHRGAIAASLTRRVGLGPRGLSLERGLPIVALGLSIAAVSTAALLAISAQQLARQDNLAKVDHMLAVQVFPDSRDGAEFLPRMQRMQAAVAAIPGVEQVAFMTGAPFTPVGRTSVDVWLPGAASNDSQTLRTRAIDGPALQALGVTLQRGRAFLPSDRAGSTRVALLNDRAARELFNGADAVGQQIMVPPYGQSGEPTRFVIVGIVDNLKIDQVDGDNAAAEVWLPFTQYPLPFGSFLLSGPLPPKSLIRQAEAAISQVEPGLSIYRSFAPADDRDEQLASPMFFARNASAFAIFALALSMVGVYGVLAVDLSRRRRELALRAALGATPMRALRFVAAKGLVIGVPGLALGLLLAAFMAQGLSGMLFDVDAVAPWVVAGSGLPLLLLTALVCWSLARRAARIQPNLALREE
ncbi:MAG: ABC transporter permease [Xanthomonadales bacterium]|nr:ABC transporter permease [Xanthomonadales bacterium]